MIKTMTFSDMSLSSVSIRTLMTTNVKYCAKDIFTFYVKISVLTDNLKVKGLESDTHFLVFFTKCSTTKVK
jgi:hypothetical protein